jgi:hypothetical protein
MTSGAGGSGATRARRQLGRDTCAIQGSAGGWSVMVWVFRGFSCKEASRLAGGVAGTAGLGGKKGRGLSAKRQRLLLSAVGRGAAAVDLAGALNDDGERTTALLATPQKPKMKRALPATSFVQVASTGMGCGARTSKRNRGRTGLLRLLLLSVCARRAAVRAREVLDDGRRRYGARSRRGPCLGG